ncbi:MAG: hypothetical protein M1820_007467 [Bogoriella megaspora]|nr:MAG: hypothetical protein M1820_007467 [Bogoriella megaspora]
MHPTKTIYILISLVLSTALAVNFSAWDDHYCGNVEYNVTTPACYIFPSDQAFNNSLGCFEIPLANGAQSIKTSFGDFQQAYYVGYFYTDKLCEHLGFAIENTGASPRYPILDGQCPLEQWELSGVQVQYLPLKWDVIHICEDET